MTYPFQQLKQSTYYPSPMSGCTPSKETKFLDFVSNTGFGPGNNDYIPGRQAEKEILQSKKKNSGSYMNGSLRQPWPE